MKPLLAKTEDKNALESLGRVTLQIVHDLKNQLNGLKLYATFLRKRLNREDRSPEERETLAKLIAGLDRAAHDMTALVRYAREFELHRRPKTDLTRLLETVIAELSPGEDESQGQSLVTAELETGTMFGNLDPPLLAEALKSITQEAVSSLAAKSGGTITIQLRRGPKTTTPEALLEWKGLQPVRNHNFADFTGHRSVHTALAAKIIEAHGGTFHHEDKLIRVWLPLSE